MPDLSRRRVMQLASAAMFAEFARMDNSFARDEPPEITKVKLAKIPGVCIAPQYLAEDLLYSEGFTDVSYVESEPGSATTANTASGIVDFSLNFVTSSIISIDQGGDLTLLGGIHSGCFELFVRNDINRLLDLRGKSIGVSALGSSPYLFIASIAAYVGLDPLKDINWVTASQVKPKDMFLKGEVDAFLGFPPEPQELRAKHVGKVLVNSTLDKPWAEYFCCLLAGHSEFVRNYPAASKRVLRAILKAADLCVVQPSLAARLLVERKFTSNYEYALEALSEVPFRRWHEYDTEDTVRFYALRLNEAGMIKSKPQDIIAKGTDWSFASELKRELK
jgi:NitT/TauT family transport system substrate-binding protein